MVFQAHRRGDEAVTAPLAVILLIVVAVALALSVMLFGKKLNDDTADQEIPSIGFAMESPTVRVVQAEPGLDWTEHFRFGGDCAATLTLNGAGPPSGPVQAGDRLVCDNGQTLQIRSSPSFGNSLMYEATFT
jgi:hypothetical protein